MVRKFHFLYGVNEANLLLYHTLDFVWIFGASWIIVELSEQFEELDFVVVSSFDAIYVVTVEIKSTIKKTAKTFESYPEMIIKILENGEEKISYSKKLSKVAGFDSETVSRRVNTALIKELKSSFLTEIF